MSAHPILTVRRASKRPRTRLGFALLDEWRISVTAFPGQRPGDAQETLIHELVHLFVGASPGTRRWHGREFKATLRRAMREGYGVTGVKTTGSYHGAYADALERRRSKARRKGRGRFTPPARAGLSDAGFLKEVDNLLAAALRLVLEEEMADALEQHQLRAGNRFREARGVVERQVLSR